MTWIHWRAVGLGEKVATIHNRELHGFPPEPGEQWQVKREIVALRRFVRECESLSPADNSVNVLKHLQECYAEGYDNTIDFSLSKDRDDVEEVEEPHRCHSCNWWWYEYPEPSIGGFHDTHYGRCHLPGATRSTPEPGPRGYERRRVEATETHGFDGCDQWEGQPIE